MIYIKETILYIWPLNPVRGTITICPLNPVRGTITMLLKVLLEECLIIYIFKI